MSGQASPTPSDNPIDHALSRVLLGDHEGALRWLVPWLTVNPRGTTGLFLLGRCLGALGERQLALSAYDVAARRAIEGGSLPMAVAAARELERLGVDPGPRFDEVAQVFHRDSSHLQRHQPPRLPTQQAPLQPLGLGVSGAALRAAASGVVDAVVQALALDEARQQSPRVGSQPLFSSFSRAALRGIIEVFQVELLPAGKRFITQGELGSECFVVGRGELEVLRDVGGGEPPVQLARLGAGALLGEMSLLSRSPRAAHVETRRPSVLLVASKAALDEVAQRAPEVAREFADQCRRRMVDNLVRTSPILCAVEAEQRAKLVEHFVTRFYEVGERIIEQGRASDGLHLIASGEVSVVHREEGDTTVIASVGVGEVVGEVALVLRRPSNADVVATLPTVTLHLPHERFLEVIKAHPALLARLYEIAVTRDEETSRLVAEQAADATDVVLV